MPRPRVAPAALLVSLALAATLAPAAAIAAPARTVVASAATAKPKPKPKQVDEKALTKQLRAYLAKRPGAVSLSFRDLTTGQWYTYRPGTEFRTASIVKVDILATLLLRHQRAHTKLTASERALAVRMIHVSDNDAASALWTRAGGANGVAAANKRFGLVATTPSTAFWGRTSTTAADQIRLLRALTGEKSILKKPARTYLWSLMRGVTRSQRWGVPKAADKGTVAAVKNGWAPRHEDGGLWTVNSTGRIRVGGHLVVVAVLSRRNPGMSTGIATVEHVTASVRKAIRRAK